MKSYLFDRRLYKRMLVLYHGQKVHTLLHLKIVDCRDDLLARQVVEQMGGQDYFFHIVVV